MKRYFKVGLTTILPIVLSIQILVFIYGAFKNALESILGSLVSYQTTLIALGIVILSILVLGFIFTHIPFAPKLKLWIEEKIFNKVPVFKNIYNFGNEIGTTFIADIKDEALIVIEADFGGFKALGVLTDKKNNIGFLISAPSPLTGVVLKLPNYKVLDMTFVDAVKINTSLGRIGGQKWL